MTNFQKLVKDAVDMAVYINRHCLDDDEFLKMPDEAIAAVVADTIMLYLSSAMQDEWMEKKTVYRFAEENCLGEGGEAYKRNLYRNKVSLKRLAGTYEAGVRESFDAADYISIQHSSEKTDRLSTYVGRKKILDSNNVPDPVFAKAFREYDEEYRYAAATCDEDYAVYSIYFYRKEHAMAFSLIAHLADYMKKHRVRTVDFGRGGPLWTDIRVRNVDSEHEAKNFVAQPNLILYHKAVGIVFDDSDPHLVDVFRKADYTCRTIKQNVFERLLRLSDYGGLDVEEVADFIRHEYPLIESHEAISFFLDEENERKDRVKIQLARKIMREIYTFEKGSNKRKEAGPAR